jgi:hypothetical protein
MKSRPKMTLLCPANQLAILDRRDPQWAGTSLWFWDVHSPYRLKAKGLGAQLVLQSAEHQPFFSARHDAFDGLAIHAGAPRFSFTCFQASQSTSVRHTLSYRL